MKKLFTLLLVIISLSIEAQIELVKEINNSGSSFSIYGTDEYAQTEDFMVFVANDGIHGDELWISDGTESGTLLLKDITEGSASTKFWSFFTRDDQVYFVADDGIHGEELWRTDGTESGTIMLKDINPSGDGVNATFFQFATSGQYIYFQAYSPQTGNELYRTDGTSAGTSIVADLNPGSSNSSLSILGVIDDKCIFGRKDNSITYSLWESDGTETGTTQYTSITHNGFQAFDHIEINNEIYFVVLNSNSDKILMRTDGSASGTMFIDNVTFNQITSIAKHDNQLYFVGRNSENVNDLFKVNNDAVELVYDFNTNTFQSAFDLVSYENELYMFAFDGTVGNGLWKTDGTSDGTALVKEFGSSSNNVGRSVFAGDDRLLIGAGISFYTGYELFESYGSNSTTNLVMDLNLNSNHGGPNNFRLFNGVYYMTAQSSNNNVEFYRYDPSATPSLVANLIESETIKCNGESTGAINVEIISGSAPFQYNWNPSSLSGPNPNSLNAGTYQLTLTDANQLETFLSIELEEPEALILDSESTDATFGQSDGSATVIPTGGISPYSYAWTGYAEMSSTLENIPSGNYQVEVEDANSCTETEIIVVGELVITSEQKNLAWKLYPTITKDILYFTGIPSNTSFQIVTQSGIVIETGNDLQSMLNVSQFSSGKYYVILKNKHESKTLKFVKL